MSKQMGEMNALGVYGVGLVLHDPDLEAGFPEGAKLNGIWSSLRLGVFTPGTLLEMDGKRYMVLGSVGQPQKLVVSR